LARYNAQVPLDFSGPYCLLHREGKTTFARGSILRHRLLADTPAPGADRPMVISMVPYAQIRERGFAAHDGGEEVLSLVPTEVVDVDLEAVLNGQAEATIRTAGPPTYNVGDDEFIGRVRAIIDDEIKNGEGSNFLFSRRCEVRLEGFDAHAANTVFLRSARGEYGAYLTFCFFDGERWFVGSSPERHITMEGGVVRMNPICGTLPRAALESRADLIAFLSDPKEINELFQVVDEELKMMSKICAAGGEIQGPYLKEMSRLVHTEYLLKGYSSMPPLEAFRLSMFAATMVGSPLENAARIIHKYERDSRRYYSSAVLLRTWNPNETESLDSAITIRTMEVGLDGRCAIQSGASIVRDSVPEKECEEIKAKAEGLLRALASAEVEERYLHAYRDRQVDEILQSRNRYLSRFWLQKQALRPDTERYRARSVLIVDNEDEFTFMLRHLLEHIGVRAEVRAYDDPALDLEAADLVLVGPGPGDPGNLGDPKMAIVHRMVDTLLASGRSFMAVCLGHQILCHRLGMSLGRHDPPLQGVQRTVELFGRSEPCGFYNTFYALPPVSPVPEVEVSADDGHVVALRSPRFVSFQFHVESVLTTNGLHILREGLDRLLT
jgi:2-amino-4-deoxychorismate synthase